MTSLLEMVHELNRSLEDRHIVHAFGGALALAFCIGEPRATADVDLNIFVRPVFVDEALSALPDGVRWDPQDRALLERDGQARLWWERTPIDIFLSTTGFHDSVADRIRRHDLAGRLLPFLACDDLAVFKVFFNRRKDWADLEAMTLARSFDVERVVGALSRYLGPKDPRIEELIALVASSN
jgi:hypothetical protein